MLISPAFLEDVHAIVGLKGTITDPGALEPFLMEQRGHYQGASSVVIQPQTTEQVADIVRVCSRHHVPIVPQGGNTGLCGGGLYPQRIM